MPEEKIQMGKNTEGHLCVWTGTGTMHYVSASTEEYKEYTTEEIIQAKILVMLFRIAKKLKVDRNIDFREVKE